MRGSLGWRDHGMVECRVLRKVSRAKSRITNLGSGQQTQTLEGSAWKSPTGCSPGDKRCPGDTIGFQGSTPPPDKQESSKGSRDWNKEYKDTA